MKEIDTETPVVWPAWCYSANFPTDILQRTPAKATTAGGRSATPSASSNCSPRSAAGAICDLQARRSTTDTKCESIESFATIIINKQHSYNNNNHNSSNNNNNNNNSVGDKMLSERSLLLSGISAIESGKVRCKSSSPAAATTTTTTTLANFPTTTKRPTIAASAAASAAVATNAAATFAALYLEKVTNEKLSQLGQLVTGAHCIDSLENVNMESTTNHKNNNINNTNTTKNNNNNNSSSSNLLHNNNIINNRQDQPKEHSKISNNVKRERLSPGSNGEIHVPSTNNLTTFSRSRSTTPTSFRNMSPHQQALHNSPPPTLTIPIHNLSTNLLNSIQQTTSAASKRNSAGIAFNPSSVNDTSTMQHGNIQSGTPLPTDFSTCNYSDFMRSLAAKYNHSYSNDANVTRRNSFFESNSASSVLNNNKSGVGSSIGLKHPIATSKELHNAVTSLPTLPPPPSAQSPVEGCTAASHNATATLKSQNTPNQMAAAAVVAAAAAAANSDASVSPFMTSFLSSLPFSQGILPPLMDMSNTQALLSLARAAKEVEIRNILLTVQQPNRPSSRLADNRSTSAPAGSGRSSINSAVQQAAQFVAPGLIYAAQLQQQSQSQSSRQSSPRSNTNNNDNTASDKCAASATPLDLSSQPPAPKKFKAETSSPSSVSSQSGADSRQTRCTATTKTHASFLNQTEEVAVGKCDQETKSEAHEIRSSGTTTNGGQCQAQSDEVNSWSIDDVCAFVGGIDICAEYVKDFRNQCIDGTGLPLLTEDHLVHSLGMKLGPALKLRSMLAKKLGGPCPCVSCVAQAQHMLALQTGNIASSTTTGANTKSTKSETTKRPRTLSFSDNCLGTSIPVCSIEQTIEPVSNGPTDTKFSEMSDTIGSLNNLNNKLNACNSSEDIPKIGQNALLTISES